MAACLLTSGGTSGDAGSETFPRPRAPNSFRARAAGETQSALHPISEVDAAPRFLTVATLFRARSLQVRVMSKEAGAEQYHTIADLDEFQRNIGASNDPSDAETLMARLRPQTSAAARAAG